MGEAARDAALDLAGVRDKAIEFRCWTMTRAGTSLAPRRLEIVLERFAPAVFAEPKMT